jgi:predicted nucleic-acid-binding protein
VRRILGTRQLKVQDAEVAWQALRAFEAGKADFADCLIARTASSAGCERTMTLDKKAGMSLLA